MRFLILFPLFVFPLLLLGQNNPQFQDLQAIKNGSTTFYSVGAYIITTESYSSPFVDKKLRPILKKYNIRWKRKDIPLTDSLLGIKHYKFLKDSKQGAYINKYAVYAVDHNNKTVVISFSKIGDLDNRLMSSFINEFINSGFPDDIYAKVEIDSIKFVNRFIQLGPGCRWMAVRNVQCPYNGQMDWTIHDSKEEVKEYNEIRSNLTMGQKQLKLLSKDTVNVTFEGKKTTAIKLILDIKGFNSLLLNLQSGAKNLIVYYIGEELNGKYISCILSHWDNDQIQSNGLPALLGEVMSLENNKK